MTPLLGFAPSLRLGAGLAGQIRPEVAEQALAALREALSNAARHAAASRVDVTVDVDADGMLSVQVTDNGTGIPADGRRSGLRNLASRAEKLGGELRLGPADPGCALARDQAGMARSGPGLTKAARQPAALRRAAGHRRRGRWSRPPSRERSARGR